MKSMDITCEAELYLPVSNKTIFSELEVSNSCPELYNLYACACVYK